MSTDRHRRAKDIFLEACDLPLEEHPPHLDGACADDPDLRHEVEALLAVDQSMTDAFPERTMPDRIGNFRLLQKLGEGGMGEVWEAEQLMPVRRRVAFKLIKWGMNTKEVLARFESERQALALMNHPNIARAYEAGSTDDGRPFFAMEYVGGVSLTEYCDALRLDNRHRLELFTQVCDGVQHAHQKGVIHRDIKPSNILVAVEDGRPVPKMIDFGVAKATSQRLTERTMFTELGQWIGTPEYMSPEQADLNGLDVDTRSDVYSLGVVLYELLAGAQPFDSKQLRTAGFDEMRRRIREDDPPKPSTRVSSLGHASQLAAERRCTDIHGLTRTLRGDLDWIVMTALEKDRTRRYGSPSALAEEIGRYLNHEPVAASPPSVTYRARKFVTRHRMAVIAGAAMLMVLIAGAIGTSVGLLKARREADTARKSADVLAGVFETMDPARPMGRAVTTREVLDLGAARVTNELEGNPLIQARMLETLGRAYLNLGYFDAVLPLVERSLALRSQELGDRDPDIATTLGTLGWTQYWLGDFRSSRESFERSLELRRRRMPESSSALAESFSDLAFLEWRLGRYGVSDALFDRALGLVEAAEEPDDATLAGILYHKSLLLNTLGRYHEAQQILERALAIQQRRLGPDHSDVGWNYHGLGLSHLGLGEYPTARSYLERSLAIFEAQLGPDHWSVAFPVTMLAVIDQRAGDHEAAREQFDRALTIREHTLPSSHPDYVYTLLPYGEFLLGVEEYDRAEELFERALKITESSFGPEHPETAASRAHLGLVAWCRGDHAAAITFFDQALATMQRRLPPDSYALAITRFYRASSAVSLGQTEAAIAGLRDMQRVGKLTLEALNHPSFESLHGVIAYDALVASARHEP